MGYRANGDPSKLNSLRSGSPVSSSSPYRGAPDSGAGSPVQEQQAPQVVGVQQPHLPQSQPYPPYPVYYPYMANQYSYQAGPVASQYAVPYSRFYKHHQYGYQYSAPSAGSSGYPEDEYAKAYDSQFYPQAGDASKAQQQVAQQSPQQVAQQSPQQGQPGGVPAGADVMGYKPNPV
jgi:hypothetical protein